MRISTKGRYSLEALLYLALTEETREDQESFSSTREIAEKSGYSEGYLEQLFIPLRKAGLIQGVRGPQGGYYLAKPPEQISAGDILRAVEGPLQPTACIDEEICPDAKACPSRRTWCALYECIARTVDTITLAELREAYKHDNAEPDYII
ncbi:MAG: Rrf2 family transcriptional regulator [Spirochaetaceae bacterium]|jgi:Rrf2 family protein|nr:Rrf2 family transcriptional regulator [Spirochaetaceae bacterium]